MTPTQNPNAGQRGMSELLEDIMKAAEDALDNILCNCTESCGGTEGVRKASIDEIAKAILAERERCALIASKWKGHPADFHFAGKQVAAAIREGGAADKPTWSLEEALFGDVSQETIEVMDRHFSAGSRE